MTYHNNFSYLWCDWNKYIKVMLTGCHLDCQFYYCFVYRIIAAGCFGPQLHSSGAVFNQTRPCRCPLVALEPPC